MAIRNPYAARAWQELPDDNCRVIWFAEGKLQHAHTRWQNLPTIHNEIWSWRNWEPDEIWAFHLRLRGWCLSKRDYKGNSLLIAMLLKEDGTTDVPKDIELYNVLLGD